MEALDLGVTLCQSAACSIFTCYLAVMVPISAIALATHEVATWLPIILLWWSKPWLDRTVLFVLSRAAFGQRTTLRALWHAQREVWWQQLLLTLTWRRLSPWRSFTQAVYQLEGLRTGRFAKRLQQIRLHQTGTALLMSSTFALLQVILAFSLLILIDLLTPWRAGGFSLLEYFNGTASTTDVLMLSGAYALTITFVEPFYVGAGFALYLNRRVELEAWDIEQEFRRAFT
jgi:hypothetical protein